MESGAQSDNPFGYTGREDDGTGLQYNRVRYYSPAEGRFISQDPLGIAGSGTNQYLYVGGDPLDAADPSGLFCIGVCISVPNPVQVAEEFVGTVGEAVTDAEELASAATSIVETGVNWAWEHKGTVAGVAAGGACVVFSAGVCAIAAGGALGVATLENAEDCSKRRGASWGQRGCSGRPRQSEVRRDF